MEKLNRKAIKDVLETPSHIRAEVLYKFLVEGLSHRKIEKLKPELIKNHGWSSWKIAKFFGFHDIDKGKFSLLDFNDLIVQIENVDLNDIAEFQLDNDDNLNTLKDENDGLDIFRNLKVRIGQAKLRKKILLNYNSKCALCDIKIHNLLVASHIKPWSVASQMERIDPTNTILLCKHHDGLFDKGHISLDENFNVLYKDKDVLYLNGILTNMIFSIPKEFPPGNNYLSEHRKKYKFKNT